MNKKALGLIVTVVTALVIGGLVLVSGSNDNDSAEPASQSGAQSSEMHSDAKAIEDEAGVVKTETVNIQDSAYIPANIQVKKGTTVTWTNQDSIQHDIVPDEQSDNFQASELLSQGESYSFTFNEVGTYNYHCTPHPFMKGSVEVVE
jgi:amicyanin